MQKIILIGILLAGCCTGIAARSLQKEIASLTKNFNGTVGIAVIQNHKTLVCLNNTTHFPLMSVFKFHVAVAVLHKMHQQKTLLTDSLTINSEEFKKNTYSPLRDKIPANSSFYLPFHTLLYYTLALSDNNACDILIRYAGGINKINHTLHQAGIRGFNLTETEDDMHLNLYNCYRNWCTPQAMAQFLKTVYEGHLLKGEYKTFLFDTLLKTSTGADKIKAGLPEGVLLAHKTGSSDRLPSGAMPGDNDAGIIFLPDNKKYYLVVFLKDSMETTERNSCLIAAVSKAVYDYCAQ